MTSDTRYIAGSLEWLNMVGAVLQNAAESAGLPASQTISLVEHCIDGPEIAPGLVQGLRFDIRNGMPSFRVGVEPDEVGDITVHVTPEVAQRLNQLYTSDPALEQVQQEARVRDELRVQGDASKLGAWFPASHDEIVRRTVGSPPAPR